MGITHIFVSICSVKCRYVIFQKVIDDIRTGRWLGTNENWNEAV